MLFRLPDDHAVTTAPAAFTRRAAADPLSRLGAVVLLAGSVRPTPLRRACGRFFLELPVTADRCVMDLWHEQLTETAEHLDVASLPVRIVVDRGTVLPPRNQWNGRCDTRFEQDPLAFRGTGGLLRDIAQQYDPDQYLIVANAAQVLFEPLTSIVRSLADLGADVGLACREDGSPTGVLLVRCGCLEGISDVGFVDLNEQALPALAQAYDVRVLRGGRDCGLPIRTLPDYLDALAQYHGRLAGRQTPRSPFAEDWQPRFAIAEPGAEIAAGAKLHDAVVLRGGRVEAGAYVVRSLVCPGATVEAGSVVVDRIVQGPCAAPWSEAD